MGSAEIRRYCRLLPGSRSVLELAVLFPARRGIAGGVPDPASGHPASADEDARCVANDVHLASGVPSAWLPDLGWRRQCHRYGMAFPINTGECCLRSDSDPLLL